MGNKAMARSGLAHSVPRNLILFRLSLRYDLILGASSGRWKPCDNRHLLGKGVPKTNTENGSLMFALRRSYVFDDHVRPEKAFWLWFSPAPLRVRVRVERTVRACFQNLFLLHTKSLVYCVRNLDSRRACIPIRTPAIPGK